MKSKIVGTPGPYITCDKYVGDSVHDVPKKEVETMAIRVITENEIIEQKEYIQKLKNLVLHLAKIYPLFLVLPRA